MQNKNFKPVKHHYEASIKAFNTIYTTTGLGVKGDGISLPAHFVNLNGKIDQRLRFIAN